MRAYELTSVRASNSAESKKALRTTDRGTIEREERLLSTTPPTRREGKSFRKRGNSAEGREKVPWKERKGRLLVIEVSVHTRSRKGSKRDT